MYSNQDTVSLGISTNEHQNQEAPNDSQNDRSVSVNNDQGLDGAQKSNAFLNDEERCVNCVNCKKKCKIPTYYSKPRSKYRCPKCVEEEQAGLSDLRYQHPDVNPNDPWGSEEYKNKFESAIMNKDITNPLRASIYEHRDKQNRVINRFLAWGALEVFPEIIQDKWSEDVRNSNPNGYGVLRISHLEDLVVCYEEEKPDPRFIHVNTGTHGSPSGATINSFSPPWYTDDAVLFTKHDLDMLQTKPRTSVFIVTSQAIGIYPPHKDIVDAWCVSQKHQAERFKYAKIQAKIASVLALDFVEEQEI